MKPFAAVVAAMAILSALPGAAGASTTAQVTIGQVTYTLTDLDPNDGVTPSIVFSDPGPNTGQAPATVTISWSREGAGDMQQISAKNLEPISLSGQVPGLSVRGSISGSPDPRTTSMSGYIDIDPAGTHRNDAEARLWSAPLDFVLSPNTALSVSASVHFIGSLTPDGSSSTLTADLSLGVGIDGGGGFFLPANFALKSGDAPVDTITVLTGSYSNTGTSSVNGGFRLLGDLTAVTLGSNVSPVPEPGHLAMLGAGLPLLLALRRRARRRGLA